MSAIITANVHVEDATPMTCEVLCPVQCPGTIVLKIGGVTVFLDGGQLAKLNGVIVDCRNQIAWQAELAEAGEDEADRMNALDVAS